MPSPSSDPAGSPDPSKTRPPSFEELYWDIDSGPVSDPAEVPVLPISDPPPSAPEEESSETQSQAPRDRSRSLRKPRSEPLSFQTPGASSEPDARVAGAAPLSPIDLAPRAPRPDPMDRAEPPQAPVKMPLQRKSGEGVEKFTRFTSRPQASAAAASVTSNPAERAVPIHQIGTGGAGFGKLKENATPGYQPSRLQEVIDHTYTHASHRRMGPGGSTRRLVKNLLFFLTVLGLTGTLIWTWTRKKTEPAGGPPPPPLTADPAPETRPLAARQEAVREGFKALMRAPDWEGKLPWVLHAERLSGRMKDFYLSQKGADPDITGVAVSQPIPAEGGWWFMLSLENGGDQPIRIAARETPQGPRFDWENLVAYGSMSFPAFHAEKPRVPQTLRVRIRPSDVYQGKYNETEYRACEISPRGGRPVLHGYAPRSSPAALQVEELTANPGWTPCLLSLHWESAADVPDAVVIEQAAAIAPPGAGSTTPDSPGRDSAAPAPVPDAPLPEKNNPASNIPGASGVRIPDPAEPASGKKAESFPS